MNAERRGQTRQQYVSLTHKAMIYGVLAVVALLICAANVLGMLAILWEPTHILTLPLYMMFAAVSLWASVNFYQTRSRVLFYRDHPDQMDDT